MPHFILTCTDKPDSLDLRVATREAHLAYVRERPDQVKLGGPMLDEAGGMIGSMLILEMADRAAAEAFAANDPYAQAGLFETVEIQPWRIVIGGLAS